MDVKADPLWYLCLEPIHPTPIDHEFVSIEFELAFAVNVRTALRLVEASPACHRLADIAIGKAVNYSSLRHSGKSAKLLTDAHRAIDEALWRLISELRYCDQISVRRPSSEKPAASLRGKTHTSQTFGESSKFGFASRKNLSRRDKSGRLQETCRTG
ncbi:hypothetical protein OE766_23390 [Pararhizobium sp. YC-54]|uniref:hypothetical protein n=1 Tax=Pararhizobium sp. YC-54 TaxID=2986920 RepID=UPI0021F6BBC0|nr:hypothetical protein [Pararhizobium sp. YC-54]MCW0001168.1 hypothetical protein [Pararhizobium sp. YC-54]